MKLAVTSGCIVASALSLGCGADKASGGFGDGVGATEGLGSADDGMNGDDGADDAGEPPPEMEMEGDFRVPQASGRWVYSTSESSSSVAVIDSETLAIEVVGVGRGPTVVVPLDQSGRVAVLDQGSDDVALLTTIALGSTTVEIVPTSPGANQLAISPDGAYLVVYHDVDGPEALGPGSDQELTVIEVATRAAYEMTVGVHPRHVAFTSDGSIAYVVTDDGVNVIPMADLAMLGKPDLVPAIDDPAIDPDKVEILVAADQGVALARVDGTTDLFATDLGTGTQFVFDLPGIPTDLDLAPEADFVIATLPDVLGSRIVEIALPVTAASVPVVVDIPGEYVGLAHLAPDGATMLLYTTVNAYAESPPAGARDDGLGVAPVEGGSTGTDTGGSGSGSTADAGDGSTTSDAGGDTANPVPPPPPDFDPRQRVTIARRVAGQWSDLTTIFVDRPVAAAGIAPDAANAMLLHDRLEEGEAATWAYTLVDLTKQFPVKKLQTIETEPGPVLFTPDGDRGVLLLRNDAAGVRRVDRIDLRTFIVRDLTLGSPPEGAGWVHATEKIFVSQEHPTGRITFIGKDDSVQTVTGFRLNDAVKD